MTAEYVSMLCAWAVKPSTTSYLHERCHDRACTCDCHPDEFWDDTLWDTAPHGQDQP